MAVTEQLSKLQSAYLVREDMLNYLSANPQWQEEMYGRDTLAPFQLKLSDMLVQAAVEGNQEVAAAIPRQAGKTESVVLSILALGFFYLRIVKQNFFVGFFAPAHSQTIEVDKERIYRRTQMLRPWLEQNGIQILAGDNAHAGNYVYGYAGHEFQIWCKSADPEANIKGLTFHVMVFEQPEDINDQKMKAEIFPMGAAKLASKIFAGTPSITVRNQYYYDLAQKPKHPYVFSVDYEEVGKSRPEYLQYVLSEREHLGEDSDEFLTAYKCQWVMQRLKFTTQEELLARQMPYAPDLKVRRRTAGWDIAKEVSNSVVTIIEWDGKVGHVVAWLEMQGVNYDDQENHTLDFLAKWRTNTVTIDATGVGDPVFDHLQKKARGRVTVTPFNWTSNGKDQLGKQLEQEWHGTPLPRIYFPHSEIFSVLGDNDKLRDDLKPARQWYQNFLSSDERSQLHRASRHFWEQMLWLERHYTGGKLALEKPDDGDKRKKDDYPASLQMAIYDRIGTTKPASLVVHTLEDAAETRLKMPTYFRT